MVMPMVVPMMVMNDDNGPRGLRLGRERQGKGGEKR
jgi:hypothetical protein